MKFNLERTIEVLERTPHVLNALLRGLSEDWLIQNEGPETWSPYDVVGHLIHGEKTDWIPRMEMILSKRTDPFPPFDRFAQFEQSKGKSMQELLDEFEKLRTHNIEKLKSYKLSLDDFECTGIDPVLGESKLRELLATWTVHDLGHIHQVSRIMAHQYRREVGPWNAFLGVLKK